MRADEVDFGFITLTIESKRSYILKYKFHFKSRFDSMYCMEIAKSLFTDLY